MNILFYLLIVSLLFSVSLSSDAFAQASYDVNIPTGAASPDAPFFWQSEKDGTATGNVDILIDDTIVWKNADTAAHTVTSGTPSDGPDDLFDSGLLGPGKQFSYKFTEIGHYPYYCLLHPWMDGTIVVTAGYSIVPNVGKQIGDGSTFFDVEYDFNRLLSSPIIDEEQKSITFEIIGNTNSDNNDLELRLPSKLIDGKFIVWVDDEKISDFEQVKDGDVNVLLISLDSNSKLLTIIGTSIVPEFGTMTLMILGMSIMSMIILSQKSRINL
ncbi:MAG: PEFG-CTERM sorting domain-containing protein [Nitrosopumilus sp.]|nr:PEFG-CTERM sorting domain-containing protein [Nitrosopumilus sp.]